MKIKGKVHCLFEQSGTFKNEFIKLGIPAEDYDLRNNFGQTDHTDDLFKAIDDAYDGKPSLFDNITPDDLIMAFYPCIFFCETSQFAFQLRHINYRSLTDEQKIEKILERENNRHEFYSRLVRFSGMCMKRGLRLIVENPWSGFGYLKNNFIKMPDVIDTDRTKRGYHYKKPTAYWFFNCEPTHGVTSQPCDDVRTIRGSKSACKAGECSEDRSLIAPEYAKNFICDFILGDGSVSRDVAQQVDLFDMLG